MQLMPVDLVRGEVDLPLLPSIFQQFTDKLDEPGAKAEDFAEIISNSNSERARKNIPENGEEEESTTKSQARAWRATLYYDAAALHKD